MEWEEFKKKLFKEDPKFKKEYDKLGPEYKIISQVIKLRREKNITQKQLASLVKNKQPNIARLESGEFNPSLGLLKKIADALGAELDIKFIPKVG